MNNAKPTWLGGKGLWGETEKAWINELKKENSLTQESLASVIDVYYGLWSAYGKGMWGIYKPFNRGQIKKKDPKGYALVPQFFAPKLTWMVMLSPSLTGTFSMSFNKKLKFTHKSRFYVHATLLGTNNANIVGNGSNNCLGPNAGTNTLDGKAGTDVVLFQGNCAEYSVSCDADNVCTITDSKSERDGRTTTKNVEHLAFLDGDFNMSTKACTTSVAAASTQCWKLIDVKPTGSPAPGPVPAPQIRHLHLYPHPHPRPNRIRVQPQHWSARIPHSCASNTRAVTEAATGLRTTVRRRMICAATVRLPTWDASGSVRIVGF